MKRFLAYIVEETLAGRQDRLKGYAIGLEVFDRPESFDPQSDTIVRVQAGQLRRRLDLYAAGPGRDSAIRIVVPKGSYVPRFEVRVPAVAANNTLQDRVAKSLRPGIVVLTLTDLTLGEVPAYFAEGLTAEIVNALVQFRYLRIITRTPSVTTRGPARGVRDIITKYDAQFVLTGNVRRDAENVRVSVSLIAGQTGTHVYSKIFERRYTGENMIVIQEEIASYVAASVGAPYGVVNRHNRRLHPNLQTQGYEVLLRYYDMSLAPGAAKARDLAVDAAKACEQSPEFSSGWAVRSLLEMFFVAQTFCSDADAIQHLSDALKYARKAQHLDSDNALGHYAMMVVKYHSGDMEGMRKSARRSLDLNPNDYDVLAYHALMEAHQGDTERAAEAHSSALDLIPEPPPWFATTPAIRMIYAGQYQYALNMCGRLSPSSGVWAQMTGLCTLGHLKRVAAARQLLMACRKTHPGYDASLLRMFDRWQSCDALRDVVLTGWRQAGLEID